MSAAGRSIRIAIPLLLVVLSLLAGCTGGTGTTTAPPSPTGSGSSTGAPAQNKTKPPVVETRRFAWEGSFGPDVEAQGTGAGTGYDASHDEPTKGFTSAHANLTLEWMSLSPTDEEFYIQIQPVSCPCAEGSAYVIQGPSPLVARFNVVTNDSGLRFVVGSTRVHDIQVSGQQTFHMTGDLVLSGPA